MPECLRAEEVAEVGTFIPIRTSSLRPDTVTAFDLFIRSSPDQHPVLYRERNLPFTVETLKRLDADTIEWFFISSRQEDDYQRYLANNLSAILVDDTVPLSERCEILYVSAQGLMRRLMDNPPGPEEIKESKQLVSESVQFLFRQRGAFAHLLRLTSYDYYTYTHSVDVFVYTLSFARRAGYHDLSTLYELGQGALLHDVGKSLIDPSIVKCKATLSDEQWESMKAHPLRGYELLDKPGGLSFLGLDVVRHHHEKLDGSGYPDGLSGKDLSPLVRICTITDIFDALTTRRPYKDPLGSFPALRLMQDEFDKKLDRELFRTFVEMMGRPDDT